MKKQTALQLTCAVSRGQCRQFLSITGLSKWGIYEEMYCLEQQN
jgi:hypothetical protein